MTHFYIFFLFHTRQLNSLLHGNLCQLNLLYSFIWFDIHCKLLNGQRSDIMCSKQNKNFLKSCGKVTSPSEHLTSRWCPGDVKFQLWCCLDVRSTQCSYYVNYMSYAVLVCCGRKLAIYCTDCPAGNEGRNRVQLGWISHRFNPNSTQFWPSLPAGYWTSTLLRGYCTSVIIFVKNKSCEGIIYGFVHHLIYSIMIRLCGICQWVM